MPFRRAVRKTGIGRNRGGILSQVVTLQDKPVSVTLTDAARQAVQQLDSPLTVEMELYFSCLIRKQCRFHHEAKPGSSQVIDNLYLDFRPIMTEACGKDYEGEEPPTTDFPIQKADSFLPKWVNIDYKNGQWQGEFGYNSQ